MSAASRDLAETAWPDVAALVDKGTIALLAVGACEQHGAHLPLTTDTDMALAMARRIAEELQALVLPPIAYGDAWNNEAFPGTLSLSPTTLRAVIEDIGQGLRRMAVRGLVIVNGHFGNREPIALAARTLVAAGLPTMHLDYPGMETLAGEICDSQPAAPGFYHADEVETAMMLAIRPAAVDLARAAPEYPEFPPTFGLEPLQLRSFNASGVFGDPRPATAKKGEALIAGIAAESVRLIGLWRDRHGI